MFLLPCWMLIDRFVSLGFVLCISWLFTCFSVLVKRLSGKSVPKMTYFVSNGTLSINSVNPFVFLWALPDANKDRSIDRSIDRLNEQTNNWLLQALYLLLQCDHDIDKAVHRHRLQSVMPTGFGEFSHWLSAIFLLHAPIQSHLGAFCHFGSYNSQHCARVWHWTLHVYCLHTGPQTHFTC